MGIGKPERHLSFVSLRIQYRKKEIQCQLFMEINYVSFKKKSLGISQPVRPTVQI